MKTIVVAAAVFLTWSGVCLAQPAGVTREMISRALPLEGAPKAEPGPYQVTSEPAFGFELDNVQSEESLL